MEDGELSTDPQAGYPPLHRAALEGDHETVRRLVAQGADVNEPFNLRQNWSGRPLLATPLMLAAGSGDGASADTVRLLLDLGADATLVLDRDSAATFACSGLGWTRVSGRDAERLQMVMEAGAKFPDDPEDANRALCHCAREGDPQVLRILLDYGINPHGFLDSEKARQRSLDSMRERAAYRGEQEDPFDGMSEDLRARLAESMEEMDQEMLGRDVSGPSSYQIPLHNAAESGNAECVKMLLDAGVDPDTRDNQKRTALYHAGSEQVVQLLLAAGVPIEDEDEFGWSPLVNVLSHGEEAMPRFRALISAGANVNAVHDRGYTVFMSAAGSMGRNREMLEFLVRAGADPYAISELGYNAFHAAVDVDGEANAEESVSEVLEYLRELGVDLEHRNAGGKTPLARALQEGTGTEVKVLCELGADPNVVAPMHQCGPENCSSMDLPLIFHATIGIGVDSDVKTEALLKAGADPWAVDADGYHPVSRVAGDICSDARNPKKQYAEFFKVLDAIPEPAYPQPEREEFIDAFTPKVRAEMERWAKRIPVRKDSKYAEETREEQLNCIAMLVAYMAWKGNL